MVDLTKDNFEEEVLKAEGTVLVDFYGDGCVPCAALMPHIHAMESECRSCKSERNGSGR